MTCSPPVSGCEEQVSCEHPRAAGKSWKGPFLVSELSCWSGWRSSLKLAVPACAGTLGDSWHLPCFGRGAAPRLQFLARWQLYLLRRACRGCSLLPHPAVSLYPREPLGVVLAGSVQGSGSVRASAGAEASARCLGLLVLRCWTCLTAGLGFALPLSSFYLIDACGQPVIKPKMKCRRREGCKCEMDELSAVCVGLCISGDVRS